MEAVSSFYLNSWQAEIYRCEFSLDNLVGIKNIQIVVNNLRSVLKWTTIVMNAVAGSCDCGNLELLNIHAFFVADSLKLLLAQQFRSLI